MKSTLIASFIVALGLVGLAGEANAGCVKGAIIGGIAGHLVGHDGLRRGRVRLRHSRAP